MSYFDYDFDFKSDKSNRFVPFIIGFLMYTVTIALMSSFFTHNITSGWSDALNGRITIEFQSNVDGTDENLTSKQREEIIKIIKSTDGIKSVKKLQEASMLKILEPWLSSTAIPDDFPFPTIFDVETEKDAKVDLLLLTDKLSKISQGVRIHDHANWYAPIVKISNGLCGFAIVLSILIFATVCATIIFITRKTLGVHLDTVKILQLIGANNSYIASQFKRYYFAVGCTASMISIGCSLCSILGVFLISSSGIFGLEIVKYLLIAVVVPLITILLVMTTSKNTVLFFLKNDKWIH
jgi:cell division transport system permease protein